MRALADVAERGHGLGPSGGEDATEPAAPREAGTARRPAALPGLEPYFKSATRSRRQTVPRPSRLLLETPSTP